MPIALNLSGSLILKLHEVQRPFVIESLHSSPTESEENRKNGLCPGVNCSKENPGEGLGSSLRAFLGLSEPCPGCRNVLLAAKLRALSPSMVTAGGCFCPVPAGGPPGQSFSKLSSLWVIWMIPNSANALEELHGYQGSPDPNLHLPPPSSKRLV
jgi:hypothetical protein